MATTNAQAGASAQDQRWAGAALALAQRAVGLATPNPPVACILVQDGRVVGRGWTQAGGRPHAEAVALAQAGAVARGATAYVTLEPCAHESARGPSCADSLIAAGVARVVLCRADPDPRTSGRGIDRLEAAGIACVALAPTNDLPGSALDAHLLRQRSGRARVTLKLATSLDGCIALSSGESRWITGERARAHAHLLRAQSDAILVGRGTWEADRPALDVRLPGLASRSPRRLLLTSGATDADMAGADMEAVRSARQAALLPDIAELLVEGGAQTAAAFLQEGLVDRLVLYRAPILVGSGKAALADIGLTRLEPAHGQWRLMDARQLGSDRLEVYHAAKGV